MENHKEKHIVNYSTYLIIWIALITLTALTVVVAGINFGFYSIPIALLIASIKAFLVMIIFMHLKYEDKIFKIFVSVAFVSFLIFIVLLFFDYSNIR